MFLKQPARTRLGQEPAVKIPTLECVPHVPVWHTSITYGPLRTMDKPSNGIPAALWRIVCFIGPESAVRDTEYLRASYEAEWSSRPFIDSVLLKQTLENYMECSRSQ